MNIEALIDFSIRAKSLAVMLSSAKHFQQGPSVGKKAPFTAAAVQTCLADRG
jgi:hypothetical protein